MERPIEQAIRSVERVLHIVARDPSFARRWRAATEAKDNSFRTAGLKNHLLGIRPTEALTVDLSGSELKVSIYESGINRQGQKIGIQLTLTLERHQ